MSKAKDTILEDIQSLTEDQAKSALQYLSGFDLWTCTEIVTWVKETYPE